MTLKARGQSLETLVQQWERERPDLDVTAFWFVGAIMQLAQKFENAFRDLAKERFDIGAGDLRVLLALRRSGPPYAMRATDLFESLLLTAGAVTKQVDRLEMQGYVERIREHGHRGQRLVALTAAGVRVTNEVQEIIATSFCNIAPIVMALAPEKARLITSTLQRILDEEVSASQQTDKRAVESGSNRLPSGQKATKRRSAVSVGQRR